MQWIIDTALLLLAGFVCCYILSDWGAKYLNRRQAGQQDVDPR